jgi:hypothetical protein
LTSLRRGHRSHWFASGSEHVPRIGYAGPEMDLLDVLGSAGLSNTVHTEKRPSGLPRRSPGERFRRTFLRWPARKAGAPGVRGLEENRLDQAEGVGTSVSGFGTTITAQPVSGVQMTLASHPGTCSVGGLPGIIGPPPTVGGYPGLSGKSIPGGPQIGKVGSGGFPLGGMIGPPPTVGGYPGLSGKSTPGGPQIGKAGCGGCPVGGC